jgi:LPXTG-motif cell wall-anchored protein
MTVGASSTSDNPATVDKVEKNYTVKDSTVKNEKGFELPETGGIGTTIFYIIGAILVLGAGVLLITRRRMQAR